MMIRSYLMEITAELFIRKYPEIGFLLVGGQPPGRSCVESPRGLGSYRPKGVAGIIFSWFVVAHRPWRFILKSVIFTANL
jgi:hypothetical protein